MNRSTAVSCWQEPIDLQPKRVPIVRATGTDVTYELAIPGGIMRTELWLPRRGTCLTIRCDDADGYWASLILPGRRR